MPASTRFLWGPALALLARPTTNAGTASEAAIHCRLTMMTSMLSVISVRRAVLFLVDAPPALGAERHLLKHVLVVAGLTALRAGRAIARLGCRVASGLQTLLLRLVRRVGMSGKRSREPEHDQSAKRYRPHKFIPQSRPAVPS